MVRFNLEIEAAILSECIDDKNVLIKLLDKGVTTEDFYNSTNQKLFNYLVECYALKGSTDLLILIDIAKEEIMPSYITQLVGNSTRGIDINALINELLNLRIVRERLKLADNIKKGLLTTDEDIKKSLDSMQLIKSKIGNDSTITTLDKVEIVDIYKAEKIPTGFVDIDKKLLGFVMGSLNIITGYNGNGKSTLINQMCIAESLSRGYKVFAYSPELTNSNFKSWLYPTIANSEHFVNRTFYSENYKALGNIGVKYIDKWIKDKLFIYSDDSVTSQEKQLLLDMQHMADKGVKVFIIDNLMKIELEGSYKNELLAQKQFVNKLKEFARRYGVVVHLVAHPRKPMQGNAKITKFDIAGAAEITNLADYVLSISRVTDEQRQEITSLKDSVVKVMKDRIKGNGEFAINLNFDKTRKRFYSHQSELDKDYGYTSKLELVQVEFNKEVFN